MSETPQIERLLKLLLNLSSGVRYSIDDITERYGISRRTFFRDRDTLLNVGFPIEQAEGRYWIDKIESPFKELHQLPYFTEEEAWIMRQAIHSIDENNQLKINLVEKLYSLYKFGKVAEIILRKDQSENINKLVKAIEEKQQVVLHDYHSAHGNTVKDRIIEPFDFTPNFIAVWAFDVDSQSNKTFKTARIKTVGLSGNPFQFSELHKSMPLDVFRISGNNQINVKLKLNLRAYNLIKEEYPMSEKFITNLENNFWLFDADVSSFDGVGRFVLGLCEEVEIITPETLKTFLKEKIECFKK